MSWNSAIAPGCPDDHEDRGIYITQGSVSIAGQTFEAAKKEWGSSHWGEGLFDLPESDRDTFVPLPNWFNAFGHQSDILPVRDTNPQ